MTERTEFLNSLIGQPWSTDRSCWHVFALIQAKLFGRVMPHVDVPPDPSWPWMIRTIRNHPDRGNWQEVIPPFPGLITAPDGALVALGRADVAAHIGCWLAAERKIIHCDQANGVVSEDVPTMRANGWGRICFFERIAV